MIVVAVESNILIYHGHEWTVVFTIVTIAVTVKRTTSLFFKPNLVPTVFGFIFKPFSRHWKILRTPPYSHFSVRLSAVVWRGRKKKKKKPVTTAVFEWTAIATVKNQRAAKTPKTVITDHQPTIRARAQDRGGKRTNGVVAGLSVAYRGPAHQKISYTRAVAVTGSGIWRPALGGVRFVFSARFAAVDLNACRLFIYLFFLSFIFFFFYILYKIFDDANWRPK